MITSDLLAKATGLAQTTTTAGNPMVTNLENITSGMASRAL